MKAISKNNKVLDRARDPRKTLKREKKNGRRKIQEKSNNSNERLFCFLSIEKIVFCSYTIQKANLYVTFLV